MTESVIEISNLYFSYDVQPVLEDVNLSVPRGAFLALIGPNGGGKTTLVKIILGLLKPVNGEVRVLGKSPHEVTGHLGYVPQNTQFNRDFPISVLDVVLMGRLARRSIFKRYTGEDARVALEALERVGMADFARSPVGDLSGGQRQRVFIARAIASEPEILFLDEPTSGVDVEWQGNVYRILKELNDHVTIVAVSHDTGVLSSYVKSVACVNRNLFYHDAAEITEEMMRTAYHCPVELLAHGIPHRVLKDHKGDS